MDQKTARVRLLTSIAGNHDAVHNHGHRLDGFSHAPGEEITIDATLAAKWCAAGIAEPLKVGFGYETTQREKPENAAMPNGKKRNGSKAQKPENAGA